MSNKLLAALLMSSLAFASAPVLAQGAGAASKESQAFLTKAIEGNLAEIAMGKLAQEKGQSQEVKDFGAMLVQDHTMANEKAMSLAKQLNVNAPTQPSKKHVQEQEKMAKLSGAQFDREFAEHMAEDHKEEISEFTKQSKMKADDPTASFASETLPVLQKHLQTAQSIQKNAKK